MTQDSPPGGPADVATIRRHNLALLVRHLRDRGPRSRTELSAETGLAAGAVTSLTAELIQRGLVRESGLRPLESAGRPRRIVELDGSALPVIGAQIDVHSIALYVTDLAGRPLHSSSTRHRGEVLPALVEGIRSAIQTAGALAGLAVGVPGSVATGTGVVGSAPNLGWRDLPLLDVLAADLGAERTLMWLDNDANLAALAEYAHVRAEGLRDLVVLSGSVGVGAGIVIGGRLFRGSAGGAGEAGHVIVAPGGPRCWCGQRGCLEVMAGLPALLRSAGLSARSADGDPERALAALIAAAERAQPPVLSALREAGRWIALGICAVSCLLNPRAAILSGYYAPLWPWLLEGMTDVLAAHRAVAPAYRDLEVRAGALGPDAPARGAAVLAVEQLLDNPLSIGDPHA